MTDTVNKYKVWCNTDSKFVYIWNEDDPTVCPENSGHPIDTSKTTIVDTITQEFPISTIEGERVLVHSSPKPKVDRSTYAVWAGCGDDLTTSPPTIGGGELLHFHMEPGSPNMTVREVKFSPEYGKVWIHEGYLSYTNAGDGDYICATVVVEPTPIQTFVSKVLIVEDNWIKPAPLGSPYEPTHGWAGTPILTPRSFLQDGDWDYDGISLTPNYEGNGAYKISAIEREIHEFFSNIPCYGTSPFFTMTSDETILLPAGCFLRIRAHNVSGNTWHASVIMEIYREKTITD